MPVFKELDPAVALKAIEGYQNELEGEQKKLDAFYRQFKCPKCMGVVQKEIFPPHAFADPDTVVPRSLLRCKLCRYLFDPHTGLTVELGGPAVPEEIPLIGRR